MNLSVEDKKLLKELCHQHDISYNKVIKLLETVHEHEFKERRTGIYDVLREILKGDYKDTEVHQ